MADEKAAQSLGDWQVVSVPDGNLRPPADTEIGNGTESFRDPPPLTGEQAAIDNRPPRHKPAEMRSGAPEPAGGAMWAPAGSWPVLTAGLSVVLLCTLGAIIWLLVNDRDSGATSIITTERAKSSPTTELVTPPSVAPQEAGPYQQSEPAPFPPPPPDPEAGERLQRELDRTIGDNPITFDPGLAELDGLQVAFVENTVAGLIDSFRNGVIVVIVGYDDGTEPDRTLALERARAVERVVLRTGIPPVVLVTEARTADDDPKGSRRQGRVELEVLQQ